MTAGYLAGVAAIDLTPPPGLPMVGFVRQWQVAVGTGRLPLEATALVIEADGARVVLCGVDTAGIQGAAAAAIVARVADACRSTPSAVLLSWNHTHLAPANGFLPSWLATDDPEGRIEADVSAYGAFLADAIVRVCGLAASRLRPARIRWAVGDADVCVNRRERVEGGTILGWNPELPVDASVTTLAVESADGAAIGTVVVFGCHPVCTGWEVLAYSADYPGAVREAIRRVIGGECVFLQGAAGNVLPRFAFTADEDEAERTGRAVAVAAVAALERSRDGAVGESERIASGSVTPITLHRRRRTVDPPPRLRSAACDAAFPLLALPTPAELEEVRDRAAARVDEERRGGSDRALIATLLYDQRWAEAAIAELARGGPRTRAVAPIQAIRIGDGVLATGPGEVFTEIGLAVKERSPAIVTAYCGYANDLVSYFPTAAEYAFGGYEPAYGNRSFGLPAQVAPSSERILVETAVRLVERCFPDSPSWPEGDGWTHRGSMPEPTRASRYPHPGA